MEDENMIPVPPPPPIPPPLPPSHTQAASGDNVVSSTPRSFLQSRSGIDVITTASLLIDAIRDGNLSKVKEALEAGENVNQSTLYGTPLSVAVRSDNLDIVKLLVSRPGCDIDMRDYDGETAFCLALRKEFTDICFYLLSQGCTYDGIDPVTKISLLATAVNLRELQIIEEMISRGCKIDIRDSSTNYTPLTHACLLDECDGDDVKHKIITSLCMAGADMNIKPGPPFHGFLIHKLVLEHCHQSVQTLASVSKQLPEDKKMDINKPNAIEHNTALNLAVAVGDNTMLTILLENGAEPNQSNVFCDSPLSKALKDRLYNQTDNIKTLLKHGADPNYEDTRPNPRRKGHCKPLFAAVENGDKDIVDLLLDNGADLSSLDYKGNCVILPCLENFISIILLRYIVDKMDAQGVKYDISSWTYIREAFSWPRHLQYLIDRGLNVDAVSLDGHRIIHSNDIKNFPNSLEIVLQNGLDPDTRTLHGLGNTMLSAIGHSKSYFEAIQLLVQYGADLNITYREYGDEQPKTPVQFAFEKEYTDPPDNEKEHISLVRYYINCGATFAPELYAWTWRDEFLALRIENDTESDSSEEDSERSSVNNTCPSTYREQLLSDLEVIFSPLPLRMVCRSVIRSTIISNNSACQIKSLIDTLHVPSATQDFLSFVNVPHTHIIR